MALDQTFLFDVKAIFVVLSTLFQELQEWAPKRVGLDYD